VAFASKALTEMQANYSNIEREALALVHGIQRFHTYLYGRSFVAVTDHKPLIMLKQKPLHKVPGRIDRMFQKISGYNFELIYRPGKDMIIADALSRLPNPDNKEDIKLDVQINSILSHCDGIPMDDIDVIQQDLINFGQHKQTALQSSTANDTSLTAVKQFITTGWPNKIYDLPQALRPYWSFRDELTVEDGIILKGKQVVIPEDLRTDIMSQLHSGHQGIEKTRLLARSTVYWPNINKDIETLTKMCDTCQEHQHRNRKEPLIPHEVPSGPWITIGTDLFEIQNKQYLLIADYFTKFPIVIELKCTTSHTITTEMSRICSMFGRPTEIVSDNGTQYTGAPFQDFCRRWGITHITSSPRYPQSNGFIERMVGTVKPIIKKCLQAGQDIHIALLNLRATPIDGQLPSPASMMFGRPAQTLLPSYHKTSSTCLGYRSHLETRKGLMKKRYDSRSLPADLSDLPPGQPVRVLDPQTVTWQCGTVIEKLNFPPRSYIVETARGARLRRNRGHLRPSTNPEKQVRFTLPGETNLPRPPRLSDYQYQLGRMTAMPIHQGPHPARPRDNPTGTEDRTPVRLPRQADVPPGGAIELPAHRAVRLPRQADAPPDVATEPTARRVSQRRHIMPNKFKDFIIQ